MSKVSFRALNPGDKVQVLFHGSKQFGNDPYELDVVVDSTHPDRVKTDSAEFYFTQNRWRYGSSAEVATILSVERA